MLRASSIAEKAGFPTASLVCEGFLGQASTTSVGLGMPNLACARVPGHTGAQSDAALRNNILGVTVDEVVRTLTQAPEAAVLSNEPAARDIVFSGSFEDVNRLFYENQWSDGLPVVPPSIDKIEAFLAFTDRDPDDVIGLLLPDNRAATIWSVAVNGVLAGCRPQYMPVLVALVETMADPEYGVEHSGNTPGSETLITINGPIIHQLDFNYEQGVLRDGFQANTSIGRFWRLYLRNVAGFLPHQNDKATFGNTWRVVLAENEAVLENIGWQPLAVDMGFEAGDNVVTISRFTGGDLIASVSGSTGASMLPYIADAVRKQNGWQLAFTVGISYGYLRPMLLLSPILAETLAADGWSKDDVKQYLFDNARMTARQFELYVREWVNRPVRDLHDLYGLGKIPKDFVESDDPERLVPLVFSPDDFMIAVSGDALRTNAYTFSHNGILGYPVAKQIALPKNWPDAATG
ncbi:MAG: hypothetical protein HOI95_29445, partial [Chromatiales bacterium]|nr:hypothetical protein [Chromatiales bacterium]